MEWRAEDERLTQRRVQARPECAGEARVAVRDEHVWQPAGHVTVPVRRSCHLQDRHRRS